MDFLLLVLMATATMTKKMTRCNSGHRTSLLLLALLLYVTATASDTANYVPDRLIVRFAADGPHAVIGSMTDVLQHGRSAAAATRDGTGGLDALFDEHGVLAAVGLFADRAGTGTVKARAAFAETMDGLAAQLPERLPPGSYGRNAALHNVYRLEVQPGTDVLSAVAALKADPHVEYAQPDYLMTAAPLPADPTVPLGSEGAEVVAVIERATESDLANWLAAVNGWDFVDRALGLKRPTPAAAAGASPLLLPVTIQGTESTSDVARAVVRSALLGADLILGRWHCGGCPSNPLLQDAIDFARDAGAEVSLLTDGGFKSSPVGGACHTVTSNHEVCFTSGANGDETIMGRIEQLIDQAAANSNIRVAIFSWTGAQADIAHKLVSAANSRNVRVEIVVDEEINPNIWEILDDINPANLDLVQCNPGGCLPQSTHINHNKFVLFSKLAGISGRHVVQTSHNFTGHQQNLYQDLLHIRRDGGLYDAYSAYFDRLKARSWNVNGDNWNTDAERNREGSRDWSRAHFFPRAGGHDPIVSILGHVQQCRDGDDKVWVAMSKTGHRDNCQDCAGDLARGTAIRQKLADLEALGCDVRYLSSGAGARDFMLQEICGAARLAGVHTKVLIIDAKYQGQWRQLVFTGSQNWNENGRARNDEAMIRIQHGGLFSKYETHLDALWSSANGPDCSPPPPPPPGPGPVIEDPPRP